MLSQLVEAEVPLVGALKQRPDSRGLKQHVRLALGVQFLLAQRLHMQ